MYLGLIWDYPSTDDGIIWQQSLFRSCNDLVMIDTLHPSDLQFYDFRKKPRKLEMLAKKYKKV